MQLLEYLKHNLLVTDGAMGTYYSTITNTSHTMSERANTQKPDIIYNIHKAYIEAGARLIRTNSFSANSELLKDLKPDQLKEVIQKSYEIAHRAVMDANKEIFIAATIGPIPEKHTRSEHLILEEYQRIIDIFLEQGAHLFLFETFSDTKYLKKLIPYIKERKKEATILAGFSLNLYGYTKKGMSAKRLLDDLRTMEGLDLYGFNCGIGAGHLYQILSRLHFEEEEIIYTMPNSGYPEVLQDRMVYMDNADYFVDTMMQLVNLGVRMVGGCCGTTPTHIQKLSDAIQNESIEVVKKKRIQQKDLLEKKQETNNFYETLKGDKKVTIVELDPPFSVNSDKVMESANMLKVAGVDLITIADSPLGKPRADAMMMASKIKKEVDIPVMPHMCCRDKNVIAMKSGILGGYMEGIRNLLLVTGDPIPSNDRNEISSVFNLNSIRLMELVKEMNIEHFSQSPICVGGALNPNRPQIDKEISRMKKKIKAGASYFLTQPIYEEATIEKLRYIKQKVATKIIGGILPLVNIRNARFIQNEITGIHIPDAIIQQFSDQMSREESEQIGIKIAVDLAVKMKDVVDGYYFMVPFNRVHMILTIIEKLQKEN